MNIEPLEDLCVIEIEKTEAVTEGGIVLPDRTQEKSQYAKVLSVGPGLRNKEGRRVPVSVKPGDRVVIERHGVYAVGLPQKGTAIKQEVNFISEKDIVAVVN